MLDKQLSIRKGKVSRDERPFFGENNHKMFCVPTLSTNALRQIFAFCNPHFQIVVNDKAEIMSELSTTTQKSCRSFQQQHGNHVGVVNDYTEIMSELSTTTRISCRSCQ